MYEHTRQNTESPEKHKSVKLGIGDLRRLRRFASLQPSHSVAALALGIPNRHTLERILARGSGSGRYIAVILERLPLAAPRK